MGREIRSIVKSVIYPFGLVSFGKSFKVADTYATDFTPLSGKTLLQWSEWNHSNCLGGICWVLKNRAIHMSDIGKIQIGIQKDYNMEFLIGTRIPEIESDHTIYRITVPAKDTNRSGS